MSEKSMFERCMDAGKYLELMMREWLETDETPAVPVGRPMFVRKYCLWFQRGPASSMYSTSSEAGFGRVMAMLKEPLRLAPPLVLHQGCE